ncbi:MAG: hypothetical protein H6733_17770 [Alphaproteobacteria bacterium]|nr:hypothetical protein [Alphaproteobacteria bacterium]
MRLRRRVAVCSAVLAASGCVGWDSSVEDDLLVFRTSTSVGPARKFVAAVPVEDGDTQLSLTALVGDEAGYAARIRNPQREIVYEASDWWTADRNKTNGGFNADVITIAWPIDAFDAPLTPGTWTVETRFSAARAPLDVTVAVKRDSDLTSGVLHADIVWAGGLQDDADLASGVSRALEIWRDDVYGPIGITVDAVERTWDGPAALASPGFGDADAYLDAVGDKALRSVSVILVSDVSDGANVFGVSGGIPGPLPGTDRSAVLVSVGDVAGRDGVFTDEEARLLSETIAHEVGHYLGLFHPMELPIGGGQAIATWDALDDTVACARLTACNDALGDNLMYPTPICASATGLSCSAFVRQRTVSPDQQGVVHRAVLVR